MSHHHCITVNQDYQKKIKDSSNEHPVVHKKQRVNVNVPLHNSDQAKSSLKAQETLIMEFLNKEKSKLPYTSLLHLRYVKKSGETFLNNFQSKINATSRGIEQMTQVINKVT